MHARSKNKTRDEYKMLAKLMEENSSVFVSLKRKRHEGVELGHDPAPVEVATPTKFLRFSETSLAELVSPFTLSKMQLIKCASFNSMLQTQCSLRQSA